jgi:hypothetical protein
MVRDLAGASLGFAAIGPLGFAAGGLAADLAGPLIAKKLLPMTVRWTKRNAERLSRAIQSTTIPTPTRGRHNTLLRALTRSPLGLDDDDED